MAKKPEPKVEAKKAVLQGVSKTKAKPRAAKPVKKVKPPQAELTTDAPRSEPPQWTPEVGGVYIFIGTAGEFIAKILSLQPLVVLTYERASGVQRTKEVTLSGTFDLRPITKQEFFERVG